MAEAESRSSAAMAGDLTLPELIQRVLKKNEELQVKLLDFQVRRNKERSEYGIFEPAAYATANDQVDNRQNSSLQAAALLSQPFYHGTNITFEGGLETLVFTGTRLHLGYSVSDLHDNLQPVEGFTNGEYQTFFGFSLSQPLFKNFGPAATMAQIRVAALSSQIAFQEYRKQLMTVISTAEATYWNLYLAQEQVRYFEDSLKTATAILKDAHARVEAGAGAQLEVLEAESGFALRRAKLEEARQKMIDAANQVLSLFAGKPSARSVSVHAADSPKVSPQEPRYEDLEQTALEWNPDYLIQQRKMQQELIRLGYARNQRLPDVQLKGSYGVNGLGGTPGQSWDATFRDQLASWTVGLEWHVPLGGNIKARNEYRAAQLQVKSAEMACKSLSSQILAGMDTAWNKLQSARNSIQNYQTTVDYNKALLDSALTRLEMGQIESGKVLDIEAGLFEARNSWAESLVRYELALIELELLQGALLQDHHIEITQQSLAAATRQFVTSGRLTEEQYQRVLAQVQRLYQDVTLPSPEPIVQRHLLEEERQKNQSLSQPPSQSIQPVNPEQQRRLIEEERKKVESLDNAAKTHSISAPPPAPPPANSPPLP
jgi:outer membrane protein TolC